MGTLWVMRAADNNFCAQGCAALEMSLTALTSLKSLNLSSTTLYFVVCAFNTCL
jgi:hypothetical protein